MDLRAKLRQIFKNDNESRILEIIQCLENRGICSVKDLKYLEESYLNNLHVVEKKKLLELKEKTSLKQALEEIFGNYDDRLDSIEKDLRDTGICYRHDIPYIDFKCLCKVFSKMDVQKLNRFIKKEFPDNQTLLEEGNHDRITILEHKLMRMRNLHRDIESMLKANLDKLRTLRDLYSAVLSIENKSCGVDAFEEILNDIPNIMLCSYFSPLTGVVSGGVACVRQLVKYFSNCELRSQQKRLLLELIEHLDRDLMKYNHGIESQMLQITKS